MEKCILEENGGYSFIKYIPNFLNKEQKQSILKEILNANYIGGTTNYGSEIPRVQKWMHNDNQSFSNIWKCQYERWQPQPYTNNLKKLQDNLINLYLEKHTFPENISIPKINSALINKYRCGDDSIAFHRDNLPEFGNNPTILVLSLGDTREIQFRRVLYDPNNPKSMKMDKENQNMNFSINLEDSSLLIMGGNTQKYYAHGIDKTSINKGQRYSITFREHISV
jgi:alkylated DNA repair dioxygenase AlkB